MLFNVDVCHCFNKAVADGVFARIIESEFGKNFSKYATMIDHSSECLRLILETLSEVKQELLKSEYPLT